MTGFEDAVDFVANYWLDITTYGLILLGAGAATYGSFLRKKGKDPRINHIGSAKERLDLVMEEVPEESMEHVGKVIRSLEEITIGVGAIRGFTILEAMGNRYGFPPRSEIFDPNTPLGDENFLTYKHLLHQGHLDEQRGNWVAIAEGKLVDSDSDQGSLMLRLNSNFNENEVFVHRVPYEGEEERTKWKP